MTDNSFLSFIAHFMVVKFEDEVDENNDKVFVRPDVCLMIEYTEVKCEFCEKHRCNSVQY